MNTTLDINKIYELIDLYKYASVAGERVELIVTPFEKDGKWDDTKRLITIGLQGGFSRDRDTFVINNAKEFDEKVLPQILAYFSSDDALGKWEIVVPEIKDGTVTCKGVCETESGNVTYLETFDEDLFEKVKDNTIKVEEETTYKKEKLTDEEKIWDEIILYAKNRRIAQDFYNSTNYTDEEKSILNQFVVNVSNAKAISIGTSKVSRGKNEDVLNELFKDEEKLKEYGLPEDLVKKVVEHSDVRILARLAGTEKRIRRKVDFTNPDILSKVDFALTELNKVDYYELRNAGAIQFEEGMFKSSQPRAILELKHTYEEAENMANKEQYLKYCDEIYGYLEKKAKNNRKIVETRTESVAVEFEKYDDAVVNSYEKFDETIDLVRYGKLENERYEMIVEPYGEDGKQRHVRISLLDGVSRNDTFNFVFTDGEEFDREFADRLANIRAEDPNFKTTVSVNKVPGLGFVSDSLNESRDYNEILIRRANKDLAYPRSTRSVPNEDEDDVKKEPKVVTTESPKKPPIDADLLEQLKKLEDQINEEARRQDEIDLTATAGKTEDNDLSVSFEKLHEYVQMYEIGNSKGYLQIFYRHGGREYTPASEEEKRNIEFATYWAVGAGIDDDKDDLFVGEKYAFNDDSKTLFNILDVQFRESVKRGIPVDMDSLKDAFEKSGIVNADKVYERLFKNQDYVDYVTRYYEKLLQKDEDKVLGATTDEELKRDSAIEAKRLSDNNERADAINGGVEQARLLIEAQQRQEIKDDAEEFARDIINQTERAEIEDSAKKEAIRLDNLNQLADAINGAAEAADSIIQEATMDEIHTSAKVEARNIIQAEESEQMSADSLIEAKRLDTNNKLLEGAREQAKLLAGKDALFDIVQPKEEAPHDAQLDEITDAYEVVEEYASAEQPTSVKIFFDKETPENAEVIISNGTGVDESVMYQRTFDKNKLTTSVIPLLCQLYAKDNELTYNKAFDVPNTNKAGLVVVGTLEKTFQVSNADKEIVQLCQRTLEENLAKNVAVEAGMVK